METSVLTPESDGRIKFEGVLNERHINALAKLDVEGLKKIVYNEMLTDPVQTWIDYWFDKGKITEEELRSEIHTAINNSE